MQKIIEDIIYLIRGTVYSEKLDIDLIQNMNLKSIYKLSKNHSIEAVVYAALENAGIENCKNFSNEIVELLKDWKEEKEHSIYRTLLIDIEREQILQLMEENKIWYLPLKGILLKEYYPVPGLRQMSDNDILFDKNFRQKVYEIMVERDYDVLSYGDINHDEYTKSPVYNFEMHTDLFGERHDKVWLDYYGDVKSKLIKDEDNSYGYHFTDEDFYIYTTAHAYNHYVRSGTGLRTLVDAYLYLNKKEDVLNWEYIEEEFRKLGIEEFESDIRQLSKKLFGETGVFNRENLTDRELKLFDYIVLGGTYGTKENRINYRLKKMQGDEMPLAFGTRLKYSFNRIFPDMEFFKKYYPLVYRHKWMLPFAYVYRIFKGLFVKKKRPFKEFNVIWKKK